MVPIGKKEVQPQVKISVTSAETAGLVAAGVLFTALQIFESTSSIFPPKYGKNRQSVDDSKTREMIWRSVFGRTEPMPSEEKNAAEKHAGSIGKGLNLSDDEIAEALREIDG